MDYATVNSPQERQRRYAESKGRRDSNAPPCPRVVAGKRCQRYRASGVTCICDTHHAALDHARIWLDENGRHVLTAEPYQIHGTDLAAFLADLNALDLYTTLSGGGPWTEGILLIEISQKDEPLEDVRPPSRYQGSPPRYQGSICPTPDTQTH